MGYDDFVKYTGKIRSSLPSYVTLQEENFETEVSEDQYLDEVFDAIEAQGTKKRNLQGIRDTGSVTKRILAIVDYPRQKSLMDKRRERQRQFLESLRSGELSFKITKKSGASTLMKSPLNFTESQIRQVKEADTENLLQKL